MTTRSTAAISCGETPSAPRPGLFRAIGARIDRWREAGQIREELGQLYPRELADLGLSASDIPAVVRGTYRRA